MITPDRRHERLDRLARMRLARCRSELRVGLVLALIFVTYSALIFFSMHARGQGTAERLQDHISQAAVEHANHAYRIKSLETQAVAQVENIRSMQDQVRQLEKYLYMGQGALAMIGLGIMILQIAQLVRIRS